MKNILLMAALIAGSFSLKANEGYSGHYFTNYGDGAVAGLTGR